MTGLPTDGPATPRPAATIMLLRDAPDLEVLLLRRSSATPFVPGAHVFPGGAVDPGDADTALGPLVDDLDDHVASSLLGIEGSGRPFWVAAVRECLEEAGVLIAVDGGDPVPAGHPVFSELGDARRRIERGEQTIADLYAGHGLRLPLGELVYVSRWITPEESPRRYDTRFFAAAMPPGQTVTVDRWEAVEATWWRAADALGSWQAGDIDLIEPTVASLELLTAFTSAGDALAALRTGDDR